MGLLGKIFGSDDVISKTADGIYKAGDALVFTPEERAKHHLDLLKAYEPFKLIQRILASLVTVSYISIWILSALIYTISIFFDPCITEEICTFGQLQTVSKELASMNNDTLGTPFAIIMGLYFSGGMLEGAIRSFKK